ncbi:transcription cofactor vestigial-like protein 1 isoform X4 [Alligator sinensis]|nr:transcription cofactor vestigial-like protein 1 isoform X4 [Alligator sinensis]
MEETRENAANLSQSKQPVKTEWGSQCVVFTYFHGDINSVVDEHFSRALSNVKSPQDLSTKHKDLRKDSMSPQPWNFSSHWTKPYQSSPATNVSPSGLNLSAAAVQADYQPPVLQSHPTQPADLWHFPAIGNPGLVSSGHHHSFPDLHVMQAPTSGGKYGSLLGLLQQERCPAPRQDPVMKQDSSPACMAGSARLPNTSQSLTPGEGKEIFTATSALMIPLPGKDRLCLKVTKAGLFGFIPLAQSLGLKVFPTGHQSYVGLGNFGQCSVDRKIHPVHCLARLLTAGVTKGRWQIFSVNYNLFGALLEITKCSTEPFLPVAFKPGEEPPQAQMEDDDKGVECREIV